MNFTVSTKPLSNALDLGVVNANVNKYFQRSCLAQITATQHTLTINLEAASITTQITLKGSGDVDETKVEFVDCVVLKQLVNTFDSSVTTISFIDGGIELHSGSSKFTLPRMVDSAAISDAQLNKPELPPEGATRVKIDQSNWKFIKDHQMYAIAMSFVKPVYTKVWIGEDGDVIVSDFDNSLFTFSKKSNLGKTCLLADTIINLFNSLPEGAEITTMPDGYRIDLSGDAFEYAAQFKPQYETDEGVGDYQAELIIGLVRKDDDTKISVPTPAINKFLSQAALLARSTDEFIKLELHNGELQLKDNNVDCKLKVETACPDFKAEFKTDTFKSVISNIDEETVNLLPMYDEEGTVSGLTFWTNNMTVVLGSAEE